ncbi:MAG: Unknown protein [uncultured Sulfurovum sp.]|uniref:Uncharacterized protein n=1 Tax=uncultured Sulfurovum sp. TaxID=269237 RepID=A0A6S6SPV4_9BACT|nr:MAG: Unknown protein [uncultured Sulfurovum sp.]
MLKIKDKYLNQTVSNGSRKIKLSEDLTQKQLLSIKNTFCSEMIEEVVIEKEVTEEVETKPKTVRKKRTKKDDKNN